MQQPEWVIVWSKRAQEWVVYEEHGPTLGCYATLLAAEAAVISESERREAFSDGAA